MATWKGFAVSDLTQFGVQPTLEGIEIPYFTRDGQRYRHKLVRHDGTTTWLGPSKPQIPYGLETLAEGGPTLILTEGESDALALRLAYPHLAVLGIPGASSWQPSWKRATEGFDSIYLSFDGDGGGDGRQLPGKKPPRGPSLLERVQADLPDAVYVRLPDGADTRDVLQTVGKKGYAVLVEAAKANKRCSEALREVGETTARAQEVEAALREAA